MAVIHQPHDKLFKSAMSDIFVAREFFSSYLPSEFLKAIDLNTLKLEKNSFVNEIYKSSESDTYVIDRVSQGNKELFFQEIERHLSRELRGNPMTIAEQLRQEGMQQGMQKGAANILKHLLKRRFGDVPNAYLQRIARVDEETLLRWSDKMFEAEELEAVFD